MSEHDAYWLEHEHVAHGNLHACDRWQSWLRGPSAARAIARRMMRVARQQRDREARRYGYAEIGGDG